MRLSMDYNKVIRQATLQYGYLDHFRRKTQLSEWILPVLCNNWHEKGKAIAMKWYAEQQNLIRIIDSIDEEVGKYEVSNTDKVKATTTKS